MDSVLHPAIVSELVNKVDVVYHLAAAVGVKTIVEQPVRTLRVNLGGTETVLDACCKFGKPVLVASTSEVYGDHRTRDFRFAETSRRIYGATTQKRWAYADSKAMDEFLALAYHEEFGLDDGDRPPLQHGRAAADGHVRHGRSRGSSSVRSRDDTIEIYGDGEQTRCFCHVDDTIRALAS